MTKTCFVIMPMGDQEYGGVSLKADQLRERYSDLIKEAILKAAPTLAVVRGDDVAGPGGITSDIFTRLMHADYVVADITYPNANVYYELGIRHACKPGTILIREEIGPRTPFDVSGLRQITYTNTSTGLKQLTIALSERIAWFESHPGEPDNSFLELARFTGYKFQKYDKTSPQDQAVLVDSFIEFLTDPDLAQMMARMMSGEAPTQADFIEMIRKKPDTARKLLTSMVKAGHISFDKK